MRGSKAARALVVVLLCVLVAGAVAMVRAGQIKPYDDVRPQVVWSGGKAKDLTKIETAELKELAPTFWFNQDTVWPASCKAYAAELLEEAKNPGLGVRALHKSGVTGKGVNVAIIDQPLFDDHPEYAGKFAAYKNLCTGEGSDSSMHGPAVMSLLVGKTIGTAPGARVYYAAAPSWLADAKYYADALDWIVEQSTKLPANSKIRVVSVSAAPSGRGSPFTKNNEMWDEACKRAAKAGILVLTCGEDAAIGACSLSGKDVESPRSYSPGFPSRGGVWRFHEDVLVPASPRTTAEEYDRGKCSYQYTGEGGTSWAMPYASGVLAMGWQIRPELDKDEMMQLLSESAYKQGENKIINPKEFIKLVRAHK